MTQDPSALTLARKHTHHRSRKPAYRGTRPLGHQGPPWAGRPGPGWGRRRGDGRRAPPAAVRTPDSSCSRPTPGAPPVGIGVVARGRHTVSGTAGHTPAETEHVTRSFQVGSEGSMLRPPGHTDLALDPCGHEQGLWPTVAVLTLLLIS